jgi:pyrimidine operon attenuation protein/uracil phosphoribosyltransferase
MDEAGRAQLHQMLDAILDSGLPDEIDRMIISVKKVHRELPKPAAPVKVGKPVPPAKRKRCRRRKS